MAIGSHRCTNLIPAGVPDDCATLAQAGDENFPVASRLLPKAIRADLLALYGFARLADDIGDDPAVTRDRLVLLDWLEAELDRAYEGAAAHPTLQRLTPTLRAHHLPREPFARLIEANRRDQVQHRYATFDDLLGYCELSANPVGRLVLAVLGASSPNLVSPSDDVCTGLQLVEHWQDVGEDARLGRVYLPTEDLARFGCDEQQLTAPTASRQLRRLLAFEVARTRPYLNSGRQLAAQLRGRTRLAIAAFAAGGQAALDAIEAADHDVLGRTCRPRPHRVAARLIGVLVGRRS